MNRTMAALLVLGSLLAAPAPAQQDYDVIIRGGRVLDGTGNPWFLADIGIWGDRVLAIDGEPLRSLWPLRPL